MKMKELESVSGVNRETVRFYIREGLLPEPERPKPNVAIYTEEHLSRLRLIKKLQTERFLPLEVVKTILNNKSPPDVGRFEDMEHRMAPLFQDVTPLPEIPLADAADDKGFSETEIRNLDRIGMINLSDKDLLSPGDAAIIKLMGETRRAGYRPEEGYDDDFWKLYVDFTNWLTDEEIRFFYRTFADKLDSETGAKRGERGIRIMNEVIPLLRTRMLLEKTAALSRQDDN